LAASVVVGVVTNAWATAPATSARSAATTVAAGANGVSIPATPAAPSSPFVAIAGAGFRGYWLVQANGNVTNHGHARFFGSLPGEGIVPNAPIVAISVSNADTGYLLVGADGGVYAFGQARFYGSLGGQRLEHPIVGIVVTGTSKGYWLVDSDGALFPFGDAGTQNHTPSGIAPTFPGRHLGSPIVQVNGDLEVTAEGGVYSTIGGAPSRFGSMAGRHLNAPIVGMTSVPFRSGYWLVASDGGVFSFGDARFYGSMGGRHLNQPVVGMVNSYLPGYWQLAADGGVFSFGRATFFGAGANPPHLPARTAFIGLDHNTGAVIALGAKGLALSRLFGVAIEHRHHWPTITQFQIAPDAILWDTTNVTGAVQCPTIEERVVLTGVGHARFQGTWMALSPDGTRLAYTGCAANDPSVHIVDLRDGEAWIARAPVANPLEVGHVTWTPDGRRVLAEYLAAHGGGWRVSALTPGPRSGSIPWGPTVLHLADEARLTTSADALVVSGATATDKFSIDTYSWTYRRTAHTPVALDPLEVVVRDGEIYFVGGPATGGPSINSGLYRLEANGGVTELRHGIGEVAVYPAGTGIFNRSSPSR
jgi:hypothetical protein